MHGTMLSSNYPGAPLDLLRQQRHDLVCVATVDHPLMALVDGVGIHARIERRPDNRPHCCVHPRRITAAGEDAKSFCEAGRHAHVNRISEQPNY